MEDITYDLVSGGVLDLAELYAADCLGSQAEQAVEDFLRSGPEPVRHQFFSAWHKPVKRCCLLTGRYTLSPRQTYCSESWLSCPSPRPRPNANLSTAPALLTLPNTQGRYLAG